MVQFGLEEMGQSSLVVSVMFWWLVLGGEIWTSICRLITFLRIAFIYISRD